MSNPVMPMSDDPRLGPLRLVSSMSIALGFAVVDLTLNFSVNIAILIGQLPIALIFYLLLSKRLVHLRLLQMGPCQSYSEQMHMMFHLDLRHGVKIAVAVQLFFFVLRFFFTGG